jgi:hypothetical protein
MNQELPPAPAPLAEQPKKSNNWAVITAVVVVVLCCCCIAALAIGWQYGDQILKYLGQ